MFFCVLFFSLIYIGWRVIFTVPFGFGALSVFFGLALVVAEAVSVVEALYHCNSMMVAKLPEKPDIMKIEDLQIKIFEACL